METCPNCGAIARPGAKFCTTCGTRLGGSASPVQQTINTASPSPEPASSSPSGSEHVEPWGPAKATIAPAQEPASPAAHDSKDGGEWDWPAPFASASMSEARNEEAGSHPGDVDTTSALTDAPPSGPATPTAGQEDSETLSAWAATWNAEAGAWSPSPDTNDDADLTAPEGESEGIEGAPAGMTSPDQPDESLPTLPDTGTLEMPDEEPGDPDFTGIEGAPGGDPEVLDVDADDTAPADEEPAPASASQPAEGSAESAPDAPVAPSSGAAGIDMPTGGLQARAVSLLNELRDLLPLLAGTEEGSVPNPAAILAPLKEIPGPSMVGGDALRAAIEAARANPRDLYAMMELGQHTGEMLALLDERDHLRAAIDAAIAAGTATPR
jgi:hypothetical protein